MKDYDVIVIGSGAGMSIASGAYEQGLSVAVIENGRFQAEEQLF